MTIHDINKIFKPFGKLNKIIIFSKKDLLKAFIEFNELKSSIEAKKILHETFLNNYGKARIYFSKRKELSFSNRYLEYWDYSENKNEKSLG